MSKPNIKNDKVIFEYVDIFPQVKMRTELKARGIADSKMQELMVLNVEDRELIQEFFNEGVDVLSNKTFGFERLKNYEGTLIYTTTDEETERLFKNAKGLVEKCFIHYLLWAWYDSIGLMELASLERVKFDQYVIDLQNVATKKRFIQPTWRPYF